MASFQKQLSLSSVLSGKKKGSNKNATKPGSTFKPGNIGGKNKKTTPHDAFDEPSQRDAFDEPSAPPPPKPKGKQSIADTFDEPSLEDPFGSKDAFDEEPQTPAQEEGDVFD